MLIPYQVDVPMDRRPWANWAIIATTAAVSLYCLFHPQLQWELALGGFYDPRVVQMDRETRGGWQFDREARAWFDRIRPRWPRWYQYVSHGLVHNDVLHLAGNMLFLFVFGNAINAKIGQIGYIGCYGGLMVAAAVVHWLADGTVAVGASGAITGITGMFLIWYPLNDVRVFYFYLVLRDQPYGTFDIAGIWLLGAYLLWDLMLAKFGAAGVIAVWAHLGGALAGIGLAVVLNLTGVVRMTPEELSVVDLCRGKGVGDPK